MDRAYARLVVRNVDTDRRVITGIASTPEADRMGDVIDQTGLTFANPLPLLLHHDKARPVGRVTFQQTARGLAFEASIAKVDDPGPLRDRCDEAWQSVKAGLLAGVSIGFRVLGDAVERLAAGGLKFLKTEVLELSLVTVPANASARIETIRSLPASGRDLSAVADLSRMNTIMQRTIPEQIAALDQTRTAKAARLHALMQTANDAGTTLDTEQAAEYDGIAAEVKRIDEDLTRLRALESSNMATAAPISRAAASGVPIVRVRSNVPKGTGFTRVAIAMLRAQGNLGVAAEIARQWRDTTPEVELCLKAAVAPGTTTDATWAGPLATPLRALADEFIELLRPATIVGQIRALRRVPFNVSVAAQTAGGVYGWVGQGASKPVTKLGFGTVTLGMSKIAGIVVLTEELVRVSNPSAEDLVRADMIAGIAAFMDAQFIDPAVAEVANVSPASITNGITPIASGGTTPDDARADLAALITAYVATGRSLATATLLMSEANAATLGLASNPLGQPLFPGMGTAGGSAFGMVPIVTSQALGTLVILVDGSGILLADDGGVTLDVSREASVQMDTAPATPPTPLVSFWQQNLVGLRAERFVTWKRAAVNAVHYTTQTYTLPSPV